MVNTISGSPGAENDVVKLREIGNFTIRKTISKNCKRKENMENIKNVDGVGEEKG